MSTPESTLVTLCAREADATVVTDIRTIAAEVQDWDMVVDIAKRHRALAYVRQALTAADVQIPADAERALGRALLEVALILVRLNGRLRRIADLFEVRGVPLLALKGPVLAPSLYPSGPFRPFADLDLMVPEEHAQAAAAALEECGLSERAFDPEVARQEHAGHVHDGAAYHRMFYSADGVELIELHVNALQLGMHLSPEQGRWLRAVPAPGYKSVLMLSWTDQLIHLAVHAHKHGFNRLIWLKDLDLLIRHRGQEIDWESALEIARSEGVTASVWYALDLLQTMLGTPVPAEWLRQLRPTAALRAIYRCVWPTRRVVALEGHMRRRAVQFHVGDSWRGMLPSLVLMGRRQTRARAILEAVLR